MNSSLADERQSIRREAEALEVVLTGRAVASAEREHSGDPMALGELSRAGNAFGN